MTSISNTLTGKVIQILTVAPGIDAGVSSLAQATGIAPPPQVKIITTQYTSVELAEKSLHAKYPAILIYCDKLSNQLREKFRPFSGKAHVTVDVRFSQDRLEGIGDRLQLYTETVCQLLDKARGDWGNGAFYAGGYEVVFEPVRQGGHNFLQTGRIGLEVEVSK